MIPLPRAVVKRVWVLGVLGVLRLLCAKTRFVSIAAIPHILFHMCRQIGFALRATTKRGGLPSGFAAGMACRRFDLKVELQAIRLPFDIPAPSTFVKRRRAIPTFGSRQAPRHECRLRGTRISTNEDHTRQSHVRAACEAGVFVCGLGPHSCLGGRRNPQG